MTRDIASITRDLESTRNNDVIYKKAKIEKLFNEDPDLLDILDRPNPKPLNKFADKDNPTDAELQKRQEILDYNEKIKHRQIVPFMKLNGIQTEVVNFIMFDIDDYRLDDYNDVIKQQYLNVLCLVHEDDMDTEYGIQRTDLLSYIVKDLLSWTNVLGSQMKLVSDRPQITDTHYYCRTLKFLMNAPNVVRGYRARENKHDKFTI